VLQEYYGCYRSVKGVFPRVIEVSPECYRSVTMVLQGHPTVSHKCHTSVTQVSHKCHRRGTMVLQQWRKGVTKVLRCLRVTVMVLSSDGDDVRQQHCIALPWVCRGGNHHALLPW
jgi:hypothetical protein